MLAWKMTRAAILPNREKQSGDAEPVRDDSATVGAAGAMGRVNSKLETCPETVVDDHRNQRPARFRLISYDTSKLATVPSTLPNDRQFFRQRGSHDVCLGLDAYHTIRAQRSGCHTINVIT